LIKGPVLLKIRGECEILGVKFTNTFILYNNNKYLPIEKGKDSIITLKKNSRFIFPKRNTEQNQSKIGTKIWDNIIKSIVKSNRKRIIIIGPSDAGKSTLTLFIANKLISKGLKPLIIDSDIGQGELSPPTCIGAAIISKQTIDLAEVNPNYINFVGNIQPIGYESRIINCIKRSYDKLNRNSNLTLINTDGYIGTKENNYKIDLIEKIQPDCIICMGENNQINDFFKAIKEKYSDNSNIQILQGRSPHKVIQKSVYDRREKRLLKYSKLFKTFLNKVIIPKKKLNAIYYKDKFFLINTVSSIDEINKVETNSKRIEDLISNKIFMQDRFVGLSLEADYEKIIGFGTLKDFNNDFFSIQTSINKFDYVFLSDIKLYYNNSPLYHYKI
jgi:polynucleotide 5'-hydroxyl-kinase GRC3/NOL9